jgi:hypothetical protein
MYNSRRHLYYPHRFLGLLIMGFVSICDRIRSEGSKAKNQGLRFRWYRRRVLVTVIIIVLVLPALMVLYALVRDYRWERSQPPTAVVPNVIGLDLKTAAERAHQVHLQTEVLGNTWYTDLPPGLISLQAPDPGERVPLGTSIGVELAITPPSVNGRSVKER